MKCPLCHSADTIKVWVSDPDWEPGTQRCKRCGHKGDWLEFCDPPMKIKFEAPRIILPGEEELWNQKKKKT